MRRNYRKINAKRKKPKSVENKRKTGETLCFLGFLIGAEGGI
nr:MAG TPA: hypothetical protein [Bacteriophage sp.]